MTDDEFEIDCKTCGVFPVETARDTCPECGDYAKCHIVGSPIHQAWTDLKSDLEE